MSKTNKTATKVEPADQKTPDAEPLKLPVKVVQNGMLYQGSHHAKGKLMSLPKAEAKELEAQGCVEILPGLG